MFEALFGPKNPTREWQRADDLCLDFDLEQGSLNGVKLGEPLDRHSFLGPIEDPAALRQLDFGYFSLGLVICCSDDEITIGSFSLVSKDRLSPRYKPYPGTTHYQRAQLSILQLTERDLASIAGEPYWRDEDADEIIVFYELPNLEWQVEFSLLRTFNLITVAFLALLADESQRIAYGVDKPWPTNNDER